MKTYGTSARCPRCGKQLFTTDVPGYSFVCQHCDENFYTVEIKDCMADYWEVNFPLSSDAWKRNASAFQQVAQNYGCRFCSYDPIAHLMDIGWEDGFPPSDNLNNFVAEIEAICSDF